MLKNIAAVLLSTFVCLGSLEVGLRAYDVAQGRDFFTTPEIVPYRIFGNQFYPKSGPEDGPGNGEDRMIRSHHGEIFPLERPEQTIRIVTFGGSTSANTSVYNQYGVHYSSLLQESLNNRFKDKTFEVINVANEAYATPHSLITLSLDVLSWDPDIVILSHNVNDLHASFFDDFTPDYANKYGHEYYNMTLSRYLCSSLRLCRTITSRIEKSKLLTYPPRRKSYGPMPLQDAQDVFRRNLTSFATLAKSNGIEVILGSQPLGEYSESEFDEHVNVKPYNDDIYYPLHEEFIQHHGRFNEIIKTVADDLGVFYTANDETFGGNPDYFSDIVHYTKEGVELLARNYEDTVSSVIEGDAELTGRLARRDEIQQTVN
jgi:hypothetical protein